MKRHKHRVVLEVTFERPVTEKRAVHAAQEEIGGMGVSSGFGADYIPGRVRKIKAFSKVFVAERRAREKVM